MKKFKFNLETLLKVRRSREDIAKRNFAAAASAEAAQKARIASLDAETARTREFLRSISSGTIKVEKILTAQRFLSGQAMRRMSAVERLADLHAVTESKRGALIEARRGRRAVEILKEKHYKRYLLEADREEQKTLDEMVSSREAVKAMERGT
jgi:flagellar FliJ protein